MSLATKRKRLKYDEEIYIGCGFVQSPVRDPAGQSETDDTRMNYITSTSPSKGNQCMNQHPTKRRCLQPSSSITAHVKSRMSVFEEEYVTSTMSRAQVVNANVTSRIARTAYREDRLGPNAGVNQQRIVHAGPCSMRGLDDGTIWEVTTRVNPQVHEATFTSQIGQIESSQEYDTRRSEARKLTHGDGSERWHNSRATSFSMTRRGSEGRQSPLRFEAPRVSEVPSSTMANSSGEYNLNRGESSVLSSDRCNDQGETGVADRMQDARVYRTNVDSQILTNESANTGGPLRHRDYGRGERAHEGNCRGVAEQRTVRSQKRCSGPGSNNEPLQKTSEPHVHKASLVSQVSGAYLKDQGQSESHPTEDANGFKEDSDGALLQVGSVRVRDSVPSFEQEMEARVLAQHQLFLSKHNLIAEQQERLVQVQALAIASVVSASSKPSSAMPSGHRIPPTVAGSAMASDMRFPRASSALNSAVGVRFGGNVGKAGIVAVQDVPTPSTDSRESLARNTVRELNCVYQLWEVHLKTKPSSSRLVTSVAGARPILSKREHSARTTGSGATTELACTTVITRPSGAAELPTGKKKSLTKQTPCDWCGGEMKYIQCDIQTREFTCNLNGTPTRIWIHEGEHAHPRPPESSRLKLKMQATSHERFVKKTASGETTGNPSSLSAHLYHGSALASTLDTGVRGVITDETNHGNEHLIFPNKLLVSYQWNGVNSCYIDHTAEIWFRHWVDWHPQEQELLYSMVDKGSFLAFLLDHFSKRRQMVYESEGSGNGGLEQLVSELKQGQTGILRYCEEVWAIAKRKGDYHCATSWLQFAVRDSSPPIPVQAHFGLRHDVLHQCPNGHTTICADSPLPLVQVGIEQCIVTALRDMYRDHQILTPEHYFRHYFPRNANQRPIHKDKQLIPCSHQGCNYISTMYKVQISWPKMLTCATIGNERTELHPTMLQWPKSFSILDPHDGQSVHYALKGIVLHAHGHFTATEILVDGEAWQYNDINPQQRSGESGPGFSILERNPESGTRGKRAHSYLYMRTSIKAVTHRELSEIESDGQFVDKVYARVGIHTMDPLFYDDAGNQVTADELLAKQVEQVKQATAPANPSACTEATAFGSSLGGVERGECGDVAVRGGAIASSHLGKSDGAVGATNLDKPVDTSPLSTVPGLNDERGVGEGEMVFLDCSGTAPALDQVPANIPIAPLCGRASCATIGGDGLGLPLVRCRFCRRSWHEVCVVEWDSEKIGRSDECVESLGFDNFAEWCCPDCLAAQPSPWDDLLMGQFILVDTRPYTAEAFRHPLYYPARIHARVGGLVQLLWFHGNMYPDPAHRPTSAYFTMNANDCLLAHKSLLHAMEEGSERGTIAIPPSLDDASVDPGMGYRNNALLMALHQASGNLLDIIQGKSTHLIWSLFHCHWQRLASSASQKQALFVYQFSQDFDFPIFPADDTTAQLFVSYFARIAMQTVGASSVHIAIVHQLATTFFRAVATRHHLGLSPSSDPLVLLLAYHGSIPPTARFRQNLSAIEQDALDGRLVRDRSDYELAQAVSNGSLNQSIQLHLGPKFTHLDSPIRAELPNSQPFVFPVGNTPVPLASDSLPPLPAEFRQVRLYEPPHSKPRPRPVGIIPKEPTPPPTTLLPCSPLWAFVEPLPSRQADESATHVYPNLNAPVMKERNTKFVRTSAKADPVPPGVPNPVVVRQR
ncbi:hypothetical protein NMY22_g9411 [Coprinellus aureogranulatus]|nr:hypothetical protein NMY22_g9411 [Coprinellus aureogranulatus]